MQRSSFNELSVFLAVAEHRSFRRAAAELEVSPSALSHALRVLEQRLGVRLLNRTTRSVALTDAGARLAARLSPAFAIVDDALAEARDEADELGGRIRITTMEHGAQTLMSDVVAFQRLHQRVEFELVVDVALVDLAADGFNAGVRLREQVPPDMVALPIGPVTSFTAAAAPDYLALYGEPLTPSDLLAHRCIRQRLSSGTIYRWEMETDGREVVIDPPGTLATNSFPAIVAAAVAGAGVCFVPEHHVRSHIEAGRLIRILEAFSPSFDGLCLFYPLYRQQTRAFAALLEHLRRRTGPT